MTKTKIALVLGGGGARGLAHIGVLKVLERNHIPIHFIVGTSIGALIGGFYAARTSIELIEKLALSVDLKFVAKMLAPSFSTSGLVDGERVRSFLEQFLGEIKIEDMTIPFSSVATDLTTGEEVIFTSGSLVDAIMASIAIPMLFNPVHYQNRYLVDGGLVNPLPVSVAYRLGAEVIIAVNVTPLPSTLARHRKSHEPFRPDKTISLLKKRLSLRNQRVSEHKVGEGVSEPLSPPHLLQTLKQSIAVVETRLQYLLLGQHPPDVLISPAIHEFDLLSFHQAKGFIAAGEDASTAVLPEIHAVLSSNGSS